MRHIIVIGPTKNTNRHSNTKSNTVRHYNMRDVVDQCDTKESYQASNC